MHSNGICHTGLLAAQISNFVKFRPVGVELFHADGQPDKTKLINSCNKTN